jgi:hypothetical protein
VRGVRRIHVASAARKAPSELLLDQAAEVARQFEAFDAYRKSRVRARAALRRRVPGFSNEVYDDAIGRSLELIAGARRIAAARARELMAVAMSDDADWAPYVTALDAAVPGFPHDTYEWVIGWVAYWYHLR